MAERVPIPFNGGSIKSKSLVINRQRAINWFPVKEGPGAKAPISMHPAPGKTKLFDAGVGPARTPRGVKFKGKSYFVSGNELLEIDSDVDGGVAVGTLNTSLGLVSMAASPTELLLVDGTDGYRWDGTTFSVIADPDFPEATTITWLDFYFIANEAGTGEAYISALNDGTSWSALDFTTAESAADNLLAVYATVDELWLLGETTTEVYYNSGNPDFPFDPIPGGVINIGIDAAFSVFENEAGELVWVSAGGHGSKDVVKARPGSYQIISDKDIGTEIGGLSRTDDAYAWIYTQEAQTFYVLTFPAAKKTYCYDFRQNFWHERTSYQLTRDRAGGHVFYQDKHLIIDYENSKFYELDPAVFTEDGNEISRKRIGAVIHINRRPITIGRFEIEFEPGVGLTSGQGSDPQAMLRYSRNGRTWSFELWRSIGKIGEYENKAVWDALGTAYGFTFELTITDPVKPILVAAYADITVN